MCLTTDKPEIKIATEDIVCYKDGCLWQKGLQCGGHRGCFVYNINEITEKVELEPQESNSRLGIFEVHEGYHSYVSKRKSKYRTSECNSKFIIPKGTKYIEGWFNDTHVPNYVSECLMYVGPTDPIEARKVKVRLFFRNIKNELTSWFTKK